MRMLCFSGRTAKEILRDPLNLGFGIGFPVILLLLLSAIQANIPVSLFEIQKLSPGIAVFGLAFITLFAASLVAKDRESAFLSRLYTTPLTAADFILGYLLPLVPIAIAQSVICYVVSAFLGLKLSVNVLLAVLAVIPISLFFISAGLMFGSILSVKQVGAVCGALLTNLTACLSGVWCHGDTQSALPSAGDPPFYALRSQDRTLRQAPSLLSPFSPYQSYVCRT